jgi:hypothetical protein
MLRAWAGEDMILGTFAGSPLARAPRVNDPRFGKSAARIPFVVRFDLNDKARPPLGVGKLAKQRYFSEYPPFTCSVVFSCGPITNGVGEYSNPDSIWSNVFFGAWEVVARRSQWKEPFGYEQQRPCPDQILRLGLADWNLFSAYIYGTALPEVKADVDALLSADMTYLGRFGIAGNDREWDLIQGHDILVQTPTAAEHRGAWRPIWRFAFGRPAKLIAAGTSRLRIKLLMCHAGNGEMWRTWICGAVVNQGCAGADEFLKVQFVSVLEFIRNRHSTLGFLKSPQSEHR